MIRADVIIGALWGDEGKGKVVGWVGHRYHAVLRVNASTNAGHCVSDGVNAWVTRQLPSVFHPGETRLIIAPGALVNLPALVEELRARPDLTALPGQLAVASSVALVLRPYIEKGQGGLSRLLGSTHQGTGPTAAARTARHALRLHDVVYAAEGGPSAVEEVLELIARTCRETSPLRFSGGSGDHDPYFREVLDELLSAYGELRALVGDVSVDYTSLLGEASRADPPRRWLLEGCNGLLLDNLHGALPHVTSASTNLAAMLCGANLSPRSAAELIVVTSAYSTCLGKRPFPTEMTAEEAAHFYERCNEVDVAEHRTRRLGWLDLPALRKALAGAAGATLHLNKLDVLSGLAEVKVCTHYETPRGALEVMPDDPRLLADARPRYRAIKGWPEPIDTTRSWSELPGPARRYVELIEEALEARVASIGVGPGNDEIIEREVST